MSTKAAVGTEKNIFADEIKPLKPTADAPDRPRWSIREGSLHFAIYLAQRGEDGKYIETCPVKLNDEVACIVKEINTKDEDGNKITVNQWFVANASAAQYEKREARRDTRGNIKTIQAKERLAIAKQAQEAGITDMKFLWS